MHVNTTILTESDLIREIKEEAMRPTCMSFDYDPTPSGEERLKKIVKMIRRFEKDQKKSKLVECGTLGNGKPRLSPVLNLPVGFNGPPPNTKPNPPPAPPKLNE